jgi:hypothetical protein
MRMLTDFILAYQIARYVIGQDEQRTVRIDDVVEAALKADTRCASPAAGKRRT